MSWHTRECIGINKTTDIFCQERVFADLTFSRYDNKVGLEKVANVFAKMLDRMTQHLLFNVIRLLFRPRGVSVCIPSPRFQGNDMNIVFTPYFSAIIIRKTSFFIVFPPIHLSKSTFSVYI